MTALFKYSGSLVCDTESENLSLMIRLSVSDGQKTEFKRCIINFYRYIINIMDHPDLTISLA